MTMLVKMIMMKIASPKKVHVVWLPDGYEDEEKMGRAKGMILMMMMKILSL